MPQTEAYLLEYKLVRYLKMKKKNPSIIKWASPLLPTLRHCEVSKSGIRTLMCNYEKDEGESVVPGESGWCQ